MCVRAISRMRQMRQPPLAPTPPPPENYSRLVPRSLMQHPALGLILIFFACIVSALTILNCEALAQGSWAHCFGLLIFARTVSLALTSKALPPPRKPESVAMFSWYNVDTYGLVRGWEHDMEAVALKEEAQQLQAAGRFEAALPLMLRSAAMRERSHTFCFSSNEFGELYLDMLKFADAESAACKMIQEAGRYDATQQTRIAGEILKSIAKEKKTGLEHGAAVRLCGLSRRPELNGEHGVIRGTRRNTDRYYIDVGPSRFVVARANFELWAEAPPQDVNGGSVQSAPD